MPSRYIRHNDDLLDSVEVHDVAFSHPRGSNVLVNGTGCSLRKNSSGVLNAMPAFEAKSLAPVWYLFLLHGA